ncbi:hypothetical protein FMM05_17890 [Flavobacterium zepuense]|uniref:Uncharacterized protein n=1 Tax=Flavobacterium zepuense TaxID=2593302 RepID=A0A552UW56_9FLAO|nr:hypothetical protein FMM05_17890 [Flavobacterium zepuense]
MVEKPDLVRQLLNRRNKSISEGALMQQIQQILAEGETHRAAIKAQLGREGAVAENRFVFDFLETDRIFNVDQIRAICIDYRLRFLDSHYFKNPIPEEAISKINALQKEHGTTLGGFKIMAPSKTFKLKNYDDPLLFAPIGNDYFYLIHKWGTDLSAYRKLLVRPVRDFGSLLFTLAVVSLLLSLFITEVLFTGDKTDQFLLIAFLFTFKSVCGVALYYCFWKGKSFNTAIWDSEFSNR